MNLLAHYSLLHQVMKDEPVLPDLKTLIARWTGQRIRRLDRYIELCIAGGLSCVAQRKLPADTGIYLATRCGAVTTSSAVMQAIIADRQSPKPLHFVNTLGNSAGFYLTQLLGVTGNVVVVSQERLSFEAALMHAWLDLQAGRVGCALVGAFDEVALPLSHHAVRLQAEDANCFFEGTHWLLLGQNETPEGMRISAPVYFATSGDLRDWLQQYADLPVQTSFIPTACERLWLPASSATFIASLGVDDCRIAPHGTFSGAAMTGLVSHVQQRGGAGIHVARNSEAAYCAVVVRAKGKEPL